MDAEVSAFLERYAETPFRYSSELLPLLRAGRAPRHPVRSASAREFLSIYELRARGLEQRASEYWRSVHSATVELCEGLRTAQGEEVRLWSFDSGDRATDFNYSVVEAVDPPRILGCLRFPVVLSFPCERVTPRRVRVRAGAAEFRRRTEALIRTEGRVLFSCFTNDGTSTVVDAALESEPGTDSLHFTLPFAIGGSGDVVVTVRADQVERV